MAKFLTEQEIIDYVKEHNIDYAYCIECGKILTYDSTTISISKDGNLVDTKNKVNFLKTREYNGNTYRICRCKDCVAKLYPAINESKGLYAQKWAKYCQYAFNVADEDFVEQSKERQSVTLEKMIKKYGEELGTEKWNEYCNKQSLSNKFEYKQEKHGMTRDEFDEYNKSRAVTLENLIERYGETIGQEKWNSYIEKQRYSTTIDYFIETYGQEEGTKKYKNFCIKRNKK